MLEPAGHNPWRLVDRREVYANRWSQVIEDRLEGPGGIAGLYGYFAPKDYAIVCALDPEERVLLVRQWRWAFGCSSWELPCGAVEDGETPATAARRELAEEAGHTAAHWRSLGAFHAADARVAGQGHAWLATGLEAGGEAAREASELDLVATAVPLAEALAACEDGRITNVATLYVLLRVARLLER